MPDVAPDSEEFRQAYVVAEGQPKRKPTRAAIGTLAASIEIFRASNQFQSRAEGTRANWARFLSDISERYGHVQLKGIRSQHIKSDLARLSAHPANNRMKAWKALFRYLEEVGAVEEDVARAIRKRKAPQTDGFLPWSANDFAQFRTYWDLNTSQRLMFEVLFRSCASISDALKLGPGMVESGWLSYRRGKTGSVAVVPWFEAVAPAWCEWCPDLDLAHVQQPQMHMSYVVTSSGRPRSAKGASQWFARACRDAGLPGLSAHGIRKGRAAMFKENGASQEQRMAILGHETEEEASRYSKSADLKRVISGTKVPTPITKLEILRRK